MNSKPSNNMIAMVCIVVGAALTVYIFGASRNDPGLRMAALVFASNICTAIVAISSLLLTGKDTTLKGSHDPNDLPPGSAVTSTTAETVQTPPVTIAPATMPQSTATEA